MLLDEIDVNVDLSQHDGKKRNQTQQCFETQSDLSLVFAEEVAADCTPAKESKPVAKKRA